MVDFAPPNLHPQCYQPRFARGTNYEEEKEEEEYNQLEKINPENICTYLDTFFFLQLEGLVVYISNLENKSDHDLK